MAQGTTVVVVLHDLTLAARYADDVVVRAQRTCLMWTAQAHAEAKAKAADAAGTGERA